MLRDTRQVSSVPVLLVPHRAAERDPVREFELGADDHITKRLRGLRLVELLVVVILRRGGDVPTASEPEVDWMELDPKDIREIVERATVASRLFRSLMC